MNAVQEALAEYQIPNSWWPIPLVNALQRTEISLCIMLVADSLLEYVHNMQHEHAAAISEGVRRAIAASSTDEIDTLLSEYNSHLHPLRDSVLLSYVHLLLGKKSFLEGKTTSLRTEIVWALISLGDSDFSRQTHIQIVVDNFLQLIPEPLDKQI